MSENFNISGNLLDFINDIGQYWTRKRGLVLTFLLEAASILIFWDKEHLRRSFDSLGNSNYYVYYLVNYFEKNPI